MKHHRLPTVPVSDLVSGLVSGLAARVVTVLVGGLLSGSVLAQAGAWQGQLKDGGQVQMDPQTRRPVVTTPQGVTTQLWDGVHRMQDGSTVTVRSGVAVPSPQGGATPAPVLPGWQAPRVSPRFPKRPAAPQVLPPCPPRCPLPKPSRASPPPGPTLRNRAPPRSTCAAPMPPRHPTRPR